MFSITSFLHFLFYTTTTRYISVTKKKTSPFSSSSLDIHTRNNCISIVQQKLSDVFNTFCTCYMHTSSVTTFPVDSAINSHTLANCTIVFFFISHVHRSIKDFTCFHLCVSVFYEASYFRVLLYVLTKWEKNKNCLWFQCATTIKWHLFMFQVRGGRLMDKMKMGGATIKIVVEG